MLIGDDLLTFFIELVADQLLYERLLQQGSYKCSYFLIKHTLKQSLSSKRPIELSLYFTDYRKVTNTEKWSSRTLTKYKFEFDNNFPFSNFSRSFTRLSKTKIRMQNSRRVDKSFNRVCVEAVFFYSNQKLILSITDSRFPPAPPFSMFGATC